MPACRNDIFFSWKQSFLFKNMEIGSVMQPCNGEAGAPRKPAWRRHLRWQWRKRLIADFNTGESAAPQRKCADDGAKDDIASFVKKVCIFEFSEHHNPPAIFSNLKSTVS